MEQKKMICPRCKEKNPSDSVFCSTCGQLFEARKITPARPVRNTDDPAAGSTDAVTPSAQTDKENTDKSSLLKYSIIGIIAVLAVVIGVLLHGSGVFNSYNNDYSEDEEYYQEDDYSEDEEYAPDGSEDSYYVEGNTYYVQAVLKVREGPGKEYRQLTRDELQADDYSISENYPDALLKKGSPVICQGMSGNWMRISSGWVCTYDEGEYLVR